MFVEHFIQRVLKALQISLYQREGSKLFTLQRAVNNVSWLLQSTTSNSDTLNQAPPAIYRHTSICKLAETQRGQIYSPTPCLDPFFLSLITNHLSLFTLIFTHPVKMWKKKMRTFQKFKNQRTNVIPSYSEMLMPFPRTSLHSILKAAPCHSSPKLASVC